MKVTFSPKAPPIRKYLNGLPVVASDTLDTGERFENITAFKCLLADKPEMIAQSVVEKLLMFGAGAEIRFSDRPIVQKIVQDAKDDDFGIRSLIHGVVQSPLFRRP